MKSRTLFFIWSLLSIMVSMAQPRIISSGKLAPENIKSPLRTVTEVSDGYEVCYTFPEYEKIPDSEVEGCYHVTVPGFIAISEEGKPEISSRRDSFVIPNGYTFSVSVVTSDFTEEKINLSPARLPVPLVENVVQGDIKPIEKFQSFFPTETVAFDDTGIYRGLTLAFFDVSPLQFRSSDNTLRTYKSITYKLTLTPTGIKKKKTGNEPYVNPNDPYLANITLNGYNPEDVESKIDVPQKLSVGNTGADYGTPFNETYLIITTNKYWIPARNLANWKRQLGYNVIQEGTTVYKWTSEEVLKKVKETYQKYPNLTYLLIIGDHEDVPAMNVGEYIQDGFYRELFTDFRYGCMDGDDDVIPDLFRGRLSVETYEQANTVVNKIINYECYPETDASFYNTAAHVAYWQPSTNRSYEYLNCIHQAAYTFSKDSEDLIKHIDLINSYEHPQNIKKLYYTVKGHNPKYYSLSDYQSKTEIPIELQKPQFAWDTTSVKINEAIDNGCLYVLYNGHGNAQSWEYIDYYNKPEYHSISGNDFIKNLYNARYVNDLNNGNKLPVVFSNACSTGMFTDDKECFAETFLRQKNGGCIAIIAASESILAKSGSIIFKNMLQKNLWSLKDSSTRELRLGAMSDIALAAENTYHKSAIHLFGDPGLRMYSEVPKYIRPILQMGQPDEDGNEILYINFNKKTEGLRICFHNTKTGVYESFVSNVPRSYRFEGLMSDYTITFSAPNYRPLIQSSNTNNIAKITEYSEWEESMINENLIWQYYGYEFIYYGNSVEDKDRIKRFWINFQFKGTSEINGMTYHNLYGMGKWEQIGTSLEEMFADFTFDRDPDFYIRQEGDKYYMLVNSKSNVFEFATEWYGSPTIESLIYDFTPDSYVAVDNREPFRGYEICTQMDGDKFPEGYEYSLFRKLPEWSDEGFERSKVFILDEYKVPVTSKKSDKKHCIRAQSTNMGMHVYNYGVINRGILPMPGAIGYTETICLNNIYDLTGKIIYKGLEYKPRPSSVSDAEMENAKVNFNDGVLEIECAGEVYAELISTDGRRVWKGHGNGEIRTRPVINSGIYILRVVCRERTITHKVIVK